MYVLHYSPGTASMCVHHALIESGAPFELREVDLANGEHRRPEYLALNPNGTVPTLVVDGVPRHEAAALMMLVAERHPGARLAPRVEDGEARATWLQWMLHLANTVQPAFRFWFYPQDAIADPSQHEAVKAAMRARIEAAWTRLDAHLARGGDWIAGDAFSTADIYATMLMRWSRNMPRPATGWPHAKALADRVRARPSWAALYEREGLTEWQ